MKQELIEQVLERLKAEHATLLQATLETKAGATDAENKAESKYDTRGLEAGYLAQGQAARLEALEDEISKVESLEARDFTPDDAIASGALVILSQDGEDQAYFLLPGGGGEELDWNGETLTVVTPDSPIGAQLLTKKLADFLEDGGFISELY